MRGEPFTRNLQIAADRFAKIRLRTIFDCCKWDPQVEDVAVLSDIALVLDRSHADFIARSAEQLAGETLGIEDEILRRPELLDKLAMPRAVQRYLRRCPAAPMGFARVMRFDFHWTTEGWRVSEVNSDVPGGFIESSGFTRLVADEYSDTTMAPQPAECYADRIAATVEGTKQVGLVFATAYSDDHQVMEYLKRLLTQRSVHARLLSPAQICWSEGRAYALSDQGPELLAALVRFFPAEWLPNLRNKQMWHPFFGSSTTLLSNPATALITQSKRLPLLWDYLQTPVVTWRSLLPQTRCASQFRCKLPEGWLLKPVFGRVGEDIAMPGLTSEKMNRKIRRHAAIFPQSWIAQQRFEAVAVDTAGGRFFPCIGAFTIDGVFSGFYGRMGRRPLIDHNAHDVAILIDARGPSVQTTKITHHRGGI